MLSTGDIIMLSMISVGLIFAILGGILSHISPPKDNGNSYGSWGH